MQKKVTGGMVDVSGKKITRRCATASARISMTKKALSALRNDRSPKGDVLKTAQLAGVMAAKSASLIIPLCHPLEINTVRLSFKADARASAITIRAETVYSGRTGVEMEALVAVTVAALTIYDMMKWIDRGMTITDVQLLEKRGGKSGHYKRK